MMPTITPEEPFEKAKRNLIDHVRKGETEWRVLEGAIVSMGHAAKGLGLPQDRVHVLIESLRDYIARPQAAKKNERNKLQMIEAVSDEVTKYKMPIIKPDASVAAPTQPKKYPATLIGAKESLIDLVTKGEKTWGLLEAAVQKVISEAKKGGLPEEKAKHMLETFRKYITSAPTIKVTNEIKLSKINSIYNDIIKDITPGQPHLSAPTGSKSEQTVAQLSAELRRLRNEYEPDKPAKPGVVGSRGPK